ncbi:MAG TPA: hypothetical protein VGO30_13510 [Mycobacterium sp.]|jgi:hypothetical protein|nr:hypothetical protein [Mycobacterium sp.]
MTTAVPVATRFLVEWYRPNLTRELIDGMVAGLNEAIANMSPDGSQVRLVMTVAVPTDEVLYGVFAADSPDLVRAACERAGSVPERMSVDIDARTF